jgi:predicted ATPase
MLKSIRLQNFFGFQDCTINLEKGANVLVGINGSGKSNFLKAVKFLKEAIEGRAIKNNIYNEWGEPDNVLFSGRKRAPNLKIIRLTYTFDGVILKSTLKDESIKFIVYEITVALGNPNSPIITELITIVPLDDQQRIVYKNNNGSTSQILGTDINNIKYKVIPATDITETAFAITNEVPPLLLPLRAFIQNYRVYSLFNTSKDSNIRKPVSPLKQLRLLEDGSNLTNVLNQLRLNSKNSYTKINDQLEKISSTYSRIEILPIQNFIVLNLDEKHLEKLTPILNISDGTLKFICLLTVLYNPNRGKLVCIDEPELGLHPDMINTLHEAIEFAAQTSQVIISTHSAHLLDYFELEQIRIFEKDDNNATIVNQVTKNDFEGWYETFNPGQMWRAGDFGGNRY